MDPTTIAPINNMNGFLFVLFCFLLHTRPVLSAFLVPRSGFRNALVSMKIIYNLRAPAGHLFLKTNLPWVAFEGGVDSFVAPGLKEEEPSAAGGATGGAMGASGTTLIPPVGVIMPGEILVGPRGGGGSHRYVRQ